jgi:molybdate transport system ATP-binding protein
MRLNAQVGALHIDVNLTLTAPWTILFGPSGSGKSTILRAICGLLPNADISSACAAPEGDALSTEGNRRAVELDSNHYSVPPHRRQIAYAPQQPALFPHLTVRDNIAFSTSLHQPANQQLAEDALALFELHPIAHRTPTKLSGGERQRVNLARAFARPNTRLMLLDEPFTGLDLKLRDQLIPRMQQFLAARAIPCISVTHDVDEALLLDAEVFRIDSGRIVALGEARTILADERTRLLNALR